MTGCSLEVGASSSGVEVPGFREGDLAARRGRIDLAVDGFLARKTRPELIAIVEMPPFRRKVRKASFGHRASKQHPSFIECAGGAFRRRGVEVGRGPLR